MYCTRCGAVVPESAVYCPACGQAQSGAAQPQAAAAQPRGAASRYAGFWVRLLAYLIDGAIVGMAAAVLIVPVLMATGIWAGIAQGQGNMEEAAPLFLVMTICGAILLSLVGQWLYFAGMESSSWQATLGKKALNLVVTDLQGRRISFARATGRYFAKILSGIILYIGFIMIGFTDRKQGLHDMMADCLVLHRAQAY